METFWLLERANVLTKCLEKCLRHVWDMSKTRHFLVKKPCLRHQTYATKDQTGITLSTDFKITQGISRVLRPWGRINRISKQKIDGTDHPDDQLWHPAGRSEDKKSWCRHLLLIGTVPSLTPPSLGMANKVFSRKPGRGYRGASWFTPHNTNIVIRWPWYVPTKNARLNISVTLAAFVRCSADKIQSTLHK